MKSDKGQVGGDYRFDRARVTTAMREAGASVLYELDGVASSEEKAEAVYIAMIEQQWHQKDRLILGRR